jgi:transcription elongation factor GreA
MANEIVLTPDGHAKLKKELEELKGPVRMRVAEAIREAKAHGDLKENAAYHEAKLNQSRLESRIADLEKVLQLGKVVERTDSGEVASLGSKVTMKDLEFDDDLSITLVGSYEGDPANDLISISSPLGSAIIGKSPKDKIEVETPGGLQRYEILKVE